MWKRQCPYILRLEMSWDEGLGWLQCFSLSHHLQISSVVIGAWRIALNDPLTANVGLVLR
jgi:hypothetical protein